MRLVLSVVMIFNETESMISSSKRERDDAWPAVGFTCFSGLLKLGP